MERSVRAFKNLTDPMRYCLYNLQVLKLEDRLALLMMTQVTGAELQLRRLPEAAAEERPRYLDGAEMSAELWYERFERCATEVC